MSVCVVSGAQTGLARLVQASTTTVATAQYAFVNSASDNYASFSTTVDAVAGTLGKSTPLGKQALNYRKHLNATTSHNIPPPVPPAATTH